MLQCIYSFVDRGSPRKAEGAEKSEVDLSSDVDDDEEEAADILINPASGFNEQISGMYILVLLLTNL